MGNMRTSLPVKFFRIVRLATHLLYGLSLASLYPYQRQTSQRKMLRGWSRKLLDILSIGIQIEGSQLARSDGGCLMVSNHVSWLDIFVLNAIYPAQFIAKAEVRKWPVIGWLSQRSGTIFIERALRQNAPAINQHIGNLLQQGARIGLFPEGTTTDGAQVGHFHSMLFQPAIDVSAKLCPVALRYQDQDGNISSNAAFTGETTLLQSIWNILSCQHLNALVIFTTSQVANNENRRVLAKAAQSSIAHALQHVGATQYPEETQLPEVIFSTRSAYSLLINPLLNRPPE